VGYTHYWTRRPVLDTSTFSLWSRDCKAIVEASARVGVRLSGPLGHGDPMVSDREVRFNGPDHCGHRTESFGVAWPADNAAGVARHGSDSAIGEWYAGAELESRACGGRCSHETFAIDRLYESMGEWDNANEHGQYGEFCKTAYRPYDIAVTACLLMLARRFGDSVTVSSDGGETHWREGQQLVLIACGVYPSVPQRVLRHASSEDVRSSESASAAATFIASLSPPPSERLPSRSNRCSCRTVRAARSSHNLVNAAYANVTYACHSRPTR
jgi:hypothetical protein